MKINCLKHGYVEAVDILGGDKRVCDVAGISYNKQDTAKSCEYMNEMIRSLIAKSHTSPFEHVEYTFLIKCPIYVARQIVRHRTASINEVSYRYTTPEFEFETSCQDEIDHCNASENLYHKLRINGVRKEVARRVLPVSLYTKFYWKMDLHNLMNFLRQRLAGDAQTDTRIYAKAILEMCKIYTPITMKHFLDHNKIEV